MLIAPSEDEVVRKGDRLLVIAEDELQARRMYSHADLMRKNSRASVSVKRSYSRTRRQKRSAR